MEFDSYTTPDAEQMLESAARRFDRQDADRRVLLSEAGGAGVVVLGGALLAALERSSLHLSLAALLATVATYLVAARIKFPVGAGWCRPTQIAFVPMLFVLPVAVVPLVVIGCLVVDLLPELLRRSLSGVRVLTRIADGAYSFGPVLVLLAAGDQHFAWSHWPVYFLAFVVQIGFDLFSGLARTWLPERILPARDAQMAWSWVTDACLSCVGLLIAAQAARMPGLVLLSIPLIAMFGLFARERQERMDNTLALSTAYRGTAMLLGDVIEDDDEYTGIHSRAVVDLAIGVAHRLNLNATQRRNVEFGALLHDVGKIRVPKEIIHKPGQLDDAEWAIMRQHTVYGEQMLRQVGGTLSSVGKVVRHSHERYDGSGYPDGLIGQEIPIEARIVCACDAYNAMTTNRPYRAAMSRARATEEMQRCAGTHFDPQVVYALLAEVAEHPPESFVEVAPLAPPLPAHV